MSAGAVSEVSAGAGIPVENPATGETIATIPDLGGDEVRAMVARAREAQPGVGCDRVRGTRRGPAGGAPVDGRERL